MSEPENNSIANSIAIIGMAGKFPGAASVEEFWRNLREGRECLTEFSEEELAASGVSAALLANPAYVRSGFTISDPDMFDAGFFGYTPREAECMDPQHRLFLECAWHALEDAGYDSGNYEGSIGVYAGCGLNNYALTNLVHNPRFMAAMGHFQIMVGNDKDFLTTRVSYKLNLKGPSLSIQTACSTSLVTVQMACQALFGYQCDMALAGGASIQAPRMKGYLYTEGEIFSPDGHCRAFDAKANGTAIGEGAGVVVLKRLEDALADRDHIYAVIRGAAVNNDGSVKVGYTAPSVDGQAAVIAMALAMADVDPGTIGYVEAHGTGTHLGDPIEIAALTQAYRAHTDKKKFCAIGSVKTNIGHLDVASGVAGLIKAVLALTHGEIPPTLHFTSPNPNLNLENSPFYIAEGLKAWPQGEGPRRAAVSAFGIGGTNAHAILEEAPPRSAPGPSRPVQLLTLSARTEKALAEAVSNLARHLKDHPETSLADAAHTLRVGRKYFGYRRAVVCADRQEAIDALEGRALEKTFSARDDSEELPPVFMFPGQGSQYVDMGLDLYRMEPAFREGMDACAEQLKPSLGYDLRNLLYPSADMRESAAERINQTSVAQPALFAVEYAMARQWIECGVQPHAMIGHSIGEYVAACLAGVFTLEEALEIVAARGRLVQSLPPGGMTAVMLSEEKVAPLLKGHLGVATINAPSSCVVSGPTEEIEAFERQMEAKEIPCRRLRTSHAFHSAMMQPIVKSFTQIVDRYPLRPPQIPFISNVTGTWITEAQAVDPDYWAQHLRQPVRFSSGIRELLQEDRAFLEIGPGNTLCSFVRAHAATQAVIPSLRHPNEKSPDLGYFLTAIGRFWLAGGRVNWVKFSRGEKRSRVSLPTYPFQHERFWIGPSESSALAPEGPQETAGEAPRAVDGASAAGGVAPGMSRHPRPQLSADFTPPSGELERNIAHIWEEVLGIDGIGVHDNFFELGGHSLMATQVVSRIREKVLANFPLRSIFGEPTIAGLAKSIAAVEAKEAGFSTPPLTPAPRRAEIPLSFAQRGMWFLYQLDPESPAYNVPLVFRLKGRLDAGVLERALREIQRRHEPMRSTFHFVDGTPIQRISEECAISLNVVDLGRMPEAKREEEALHLSRLEALKTFDLSAGPLTRVSLLRLGAEEHLLLITMHHIVSDAWSFGVFILELSGLYNAFEDGGESPLQDLPVQYADFVQWQAQWLTGDVLESELGHWRKHLQGELSVLNLPVDRPRPPVPSFRGASRAFVLPEGLTRALHSLSQKSGSTLFMTLLAAFTAVLHRYTGQDDIVVGTPIANRIRPELEKLIGLFINTLALRTDLSGDPTFLELMGRVRETTLGSYGHQDVPFGQLVEALKPERDPSYNPIYQVMFVLQNAPMPPLALNGVDAQVLSTGSDTTELDLIFNMWEKGDVLEGVVNYNTDIFNDDTAERIMGHFQTLLENAVSDPQKRISEIPLLSQPERRRLLVDWNAARADFPGNECLHRIFEAQVERTPDAPAVLFEGRTLSYRELNARANRLARRLRALGVGPDKLVGIYIERSVEMAAALLAVLKAGGAYVPLDTDYPKDRLQFMIQDTGMRILLTQESFQQELCALESVEIVAVKEGPGEPSAEEARNLEDGPDSRHLAYVIYTSGSTGVPKGVMVPHGAICNQMRWRQQDYPLVPSDGVLQKTPISFDPSVWEFFGPLLAGARLVMARPEGHRDSDYLVDVINNDCVTVLDLVPSHLFALLDNPRFAACKKLRRVFCGGEAVTPELARAFYAVTDAELIDVYGPTECAIDATHYKCPRDEVPANIPIGRPITNVQAYVLDANLAPLPQGVIGELYLGGAQIARGYLNRAGLTAERFIPDPFAARKGARMYKTGDLARWRSDGNIEFFGRADHQVKLRGFRIELGEIETRLREHPAVGDAVVMARDTALSSAQLVAYVVTESASVVGSPPAPEDLRAWLKKTLPEYMIPTFFVTMDAFPMMPNGKVDRRALPAPDVSARAGTTAQSAAPRTKAEETLAKIWSEVLNLDHVGIHDNFFELGGDSILSIQVVHRANQAGLKLAPRLIFQHQTVSELAAAAHVTQGIQAEQGTVSGPLPLIPIQRWFFDQDYVGANHWNQAMMLEASKSLDPSVLQTALQRLVAHHDALRTRFTRTKTPSPKEPSLEWEQSIAPLDEKAGRLVRFDFSKLQEKKRAEAMEKAVAGLHGSLNLSEGPLLCAAMFELGGDRPPLVLLIVHHLVVDFVSWQILLDDLETVYGQLSRKEEIRLPEKTTSFKYWANGLVEKAQSPAVLQEHDFWIAHPWDRVVSLPVDRPNGDNTMESARIARGSLTKDETSSLLQEVPKVYHTQINDILLMALAKTLGRWTGKNVALVDLEGHGREDILEGVDLARTVGWFTSSFPVLIDLENAQSPGDAIKAVKEQLRGIPNHGIGFGLLSSLTKDPEVHRRLRALPCPQICFNYLGQPSRGSSSESALFRIMWDAAGPLRHPKGKRSYLLEVDAIIGDGQLRVDWTYSERMHARETAESLARWFVEELRSFLAHCASPEAGGFTPSDFPEADLSQNDLDEIMVKLAKSEVPKRK